MGERFIIKKNKMCEDSTLCTELLHNLHSTEISVIALIPKISLMKLNISF